MPRRPQLVFPIALIIEALIFFRHVLFYPGYVLPWDFRSVHVPLAAFAAGSFRRGEFPLWDPFTYCGNPIFANIQAALFYPPVLCSAIAAAFTGDGAIPRLLAFVVGAHVIFAGLCTYAFAKRIGMTAPAAWIAATVYELGCFFAAQAEHMGVMEGASWLPLCWWAVLKLRDGLDWRSISLLALAMSMPVLSGSPPCAIAVLGSTLAFAVLVPAFRLGRSKLPAHAALAVLWALALASIQIIPTVQLTRYSVAKYRAEWLKTGGGMSPGALLTLVIPNYWSVFDLSKFHGPTDLTFLYLYSSLLGLALALGVMLWKPDRWTGAFTALTLAAAIAMLGDNTPIGRAALALLPIDARIAIHPEYIFCVFSLGLAILAGFGAGRLLKDTRLQLIAGIIIACDLILVSSGRPMNSMSLKAEPGFTHDSIDGSSELATRLRALTGATLPPSRFDMLEGMPFVWSSMAPLIAIPTANGCDPLAPERVIRVRLAFSPGPRWGACFQVVNPSSPALNLANDRYVLSIRSIDSPALRQVDSIGGYRFYENPRVLPRFFFVGRLRYARDLDEAAGILQSPGFDPAQAAIVEGAPSLTAATSAGNVTISSYRPAAVDLNVSTPAPSFLVAADAWYPGWRAYIDGKSAPIYITDVAFRGLNVPAGTHKIEMRFAPRILYLSASISAAALILLAIAARSKFRAP